jgi:hypothetical protein
MRSTTIRSIPAVACLLLATSACDREAALDVRTFSLRYLQPSEADQLIRPYVYTDRADAPGLVTAAGGAITVRETPDNLDKIARVLAELDVARPGLRLHFQLIEADGFTNSDEAIADVEEELRKIFQFEGYRLAGEAVIFATDGADFSQPIRIGPEDYSLSGSVRRLSEGAIRLQRVSFCCRENGGGLETSVVIRPGQTLVLGSSPTDGASSTLLLTVRAEDVPGPA